MKVEATLQQVHRDLRLSRDDSFRVAHTAPSRFGPGEVVRVAHDFAGVEVLGDAVVLSVSDGFVRAATARVVPGLSSAALRGRASERRAEAAALAMLRTEGIRHRSLRCELNFERPVGRPSGFPDLTYICRSVEP
jgi:hypothetical protein